MMVRLLAVLMFICGSHAFMPQGWIRTHVVRSANDIFDADFERVTDEPESDEWLDERRDVMAKLFQDDESSFNAKTLLDLSLDMDSRWNGVKVNFVDENDRSMECKLAFTIPLDGVTYGIGIPHDHPVLICIEHPDEEVEMLDPDDDENQELMEIMAGALQKYMGGDLKLKRTPRILTVIGDLDAHTKGWENDLFGDVGRDITPEKLLEKNENITVDSFLELMKETFGEEEYEKMLAEDVDLDDNILDLFNVPEPTVEQQEQWAREISEGNIGGAVYKELADIGLNPKDSGSGLKLCGFRFKDGKFYSIVRPFQQYTAVGKQSKSGNQVIFQLLTKEEERIVLPKLQEVAKKDLEKTGLSLENPTDASAGFMP